MLVLCPRASFSYLFSIVIHCSVWNFCKNCESNYLAFGGIVKNVIEMDGVTKYISFFFSFFILDIQITFFLVGCSLDCHEFLERFGNTQHPKHITYFTFIADFRLAINATKCEPKCIFFYFSVWIYLEFGKKKLSFYFSVNPRQCLNRSLCIFIFWQRTIFMWMPQED